jgi:hypothetical protein
MKKIWPEAVDPQKVEKQKTSSEFFVVERHRENLLKQEIEYKEFLESQKRLNPKPDGHEEPRSDLKLENPKRREFLYDSESVSKALQDRNRETYSAKDMDDEFAGSKAPNKNSRDKDLWKNADVEASDDFDLDSPIPKPRELRTLMQAQTQNVLKLQDELSSLSQKLQLQQQEPPERKEVIVKGRRGRLF